MTSTPLLPPVFAETISVVQRPRLDDLGAGRALFVVHVIWSVVDPDVDLGAVIESISQDAPRAIFTLQGDAPNGGRGLCWVALIEDANEGPKGSLKARQHRIQVLFDRTGLEGRVETSGFTDGDVCSAFAREGVKLRGWTLAHRLWALIYQRLTTTNLSAIAEAATSSDLKGRRLWEFREDRLDEMLDDWAADAQERLSARWPKTSETDSEVVVTMPFSETGQCPVCLSEGKLQFCVWGMPAGPDPRGFIKGCVLPLGPPSWYRCAHCGTEFSGLGLKMEEQPTAVAGASCRVPNSIGHRDTRFSTACDTLKQMLDLLGLDDVDDLETFLMFLVQRPVTLTHDAGDDGPAHIEVGYFGKRRRRLSRTFEFPMSLEELARDSFDEDAGTHLGPYKTHSSQDYAAQDLPRMTADQLLAVLRDALGMTQMYKLHYDE